MELQSSVIANLKRMALFCGHAAGKEYSALTPGDYTRQRGYSTLDYRRHLPNIDLDISVNAQLVPHTRQYFSVNSMTDNGLYPFRVHNAYTVLHAAPGACVHNTLLTLSPPIP